MFLYHYAKKNFAQNVTLALLFYFGVKLYYKIDKLEDDVNTIVKELAINNEIRLDDKEE